MAAESRTAILAAILANLVIAIVKLAASAISGSVAMFAEAIHSFVDTGNGGLLLLGMRLARQPADERHPFGRGMETYFWTFVVAVLIFGVGGGISFYEGIKHVIHPAELHDPTINYIVLVIATLVEGGAWVIAFRGFQHERGQRSMWAAIRGSKDPTTFAVLLEDTAALTGLVVAFLGVFFAHRLQMPVLEGVASVLIGLILAGTAWILAWETRSLLIGESAPEQTVRSIQRIAETDPGVQRASRPLTMHMGPHDILVALDLEFRDELTATQVEQSVDRIEAAIRHAHPRVKRIFIEAEAITSTMHPAPPGTTS